MRSSPSLACVSLSLLLIACAVPASTAVVATRVELFSEASMVTTGSAVSLWAIVTSVDEPSPAPTGRVDFYDGLAFLGSGDLVEVDGRMRASLRVPALAEGIHPITARYLGDDAHLDSQSEPLVQTVTPTTN